jgi:hypothetical protein
VIVKIGVLKIREMRVKKYAPMLQKVKHSFPGIPPTYFIMIVEAPLIRAPEAAATFAGIEEAEAYAASEKRMTKMKSW